MIGSLAEAFSYDAPVITLLAPWNLPPRAASPIMIDGTNFNTYDLTGTASLVTSSTTGCSTTTWTSVSKVYCTVPPGDTGSVSIVYSTSTLLGTGVVIFTYDSPVVTYNQPSNAPTSGGGSMTLVGANFGTVSLTPSMSIGTSACQTAMWTTSTSLQCLMTSGGGMQHSLTLTVGGRLSTLVGAFSFDSPVISLVNPNNGVVDLGSYITMSGMNMGATNTSPTARLGTTACATSIYTSDTSLLCAVPLGSSSNVVIAVTVTSQVGFSDSEQARRFTFDGPLVTGISGVYNSPTLADGSRSITVAGSHFSTVDMTPGVFVHNQLCGTSSWTSSSSVRCRTPEGGGAFRSVAVSISSVYGTLFAAFTYDSPLITHVSPDFGSGLGGTHVTISGQNLGNSLNEMQLRIGSTLCASVTVIAPHSQLGCLTAAGTGSSHASSITASGLYSSRTSSYSYMDILQLGSLEPLSGLPTGGQWITLSGTNFGTDPSALTIMIGEQKCTNVTVLSGTTLVALTPAGSGAYQAVRVRARPPQPRLNQSTVTDALWLSTARHTW
jgi:hypothetical protein